MDNICKTSPFKTFFPAETPAKRPDGSTLTFRLYAPVSGRDSRLYIIGNSERLGGWNTDRAVEMAAVDYPYWQVSFDSQTELTTEFEYKFIVKRGREVVWEQGDNRRYRLTPESNGATVEASFRGMSEWRGAGVAIPVFSLRTNQSQGIGDFVDLRLMADWASATGQRVIQILPINDTTQNFDWRDSYPYKAISIFALHPLYLSITEMGGRASTEQRALNALPQVDYDAVGELKWKFFRSEFARRGEECLSTREFKVFYAKNRDWLDSYAAFCYLRDTHHSAEFASWGDDAQYSARRVAAICSDTFADRQKVAIYLWLQYHLDRQLRETVEYCKSKGVVLKGDIPIGISRDSVEAWSDGKLFHMDSQAGAPPDDFSATGQNWGFPTYNWEVMAADGYAWWRRRFEKMADYFDLYRIDHILGFFRIWEIPMDSVNGLLGHFNPALPFSEAELAERGLPMNRDRFLRPQIHSDYLATYFGSEDWTPYLTPTDGGYYSLKPEYDTQRKIQARLEGVNDAAKEALYALTGEVLFVEDPQRGGFFHPRIAAQQTMSYKWLSDVERKRYDELYNDFFYRRHNDFWGGEAMKKLPALVGATEMLCCGEDLGMVPDCVSPVMAKLGILSLEIQRMPKNPSLQFGLTNHYPYMCVATTSTHDMSTVRGWWREDAATTQRYYNDILWQSGKAPAEASAELCALVVNNHLCSPAALTILPLQDWLSIDATVRHPDAAAERINVPANPNHYWRYRMHLSIEELLRHEGLNRRIADMTNRSGR